MNLYRKNVAAVIRWTDKYLALQRTDFKVSWQCVQGGVEDSESLLDGMYREILEEIGVKLEQLEMLHCSRFWRRYNFISNSNKLPDPEKSKYVGQDQLWFLFEIKSNDIPILTLDHNEFSDFKFLPLKELLDVYPSFKKSLVVDYCQEISHLCA